jgi:histone H3/H4
MSEAKESKSFVVKNAVGEYIRAKELKVSSDLFEDDGLNGIVKQVLDKACERCKANGRKTVMKQDL